MKKSTKRLLLILDAVLVLALIAGVWLYQRRSAEKERQAIGEEDLSRRYARSVTINGESVPLRRRLSALLLIGTDNFIDDAKQNEIEAFYNNNLSDFLVVLVFDHAAKTVTPFQINRDTMCDVPWLSVNGLVGGTEFQQITFAHTYGTGKEDSCVNTRNAVSSLLYGVPIDNFFSFTMDAGPLMNDAVGGVTVTLDEDIPALGPEYVRGASVTLRGQDALRFVRWRDTEKLDSNQPRMARHRLYLQAFTDAARKAMSADEDLATKLFKAAEPFLCTDLTVEQIADISAALRDYTVLPVVTPNGQYVMGEDYAEFYLDEASLAECVKSAFCSPDAP